MKHPDYCLSQAWKEDVFNFHGDFQSKGFPLAAPNNMKDSISISENEENEL
jgi:hypothetical protein